MMHPMPTITRIAILNRGEPAMRFVRGLREYNLARGTSIEAVAVYTDPDAGAPFVRDADAALCLGPALCVDGQQRSVSAYLAYDSVIPALVHAGCDAVWPGWGFASEDPIFVAALEKADIVFLGPSSAAMALLGDKVASKELALECDVPLAPWTRLDDDIDDESLAAAGERVGYPLMVKASAGGGGRGIRRVHDPGDLGAAVGAVRDEVRRIFGQGTVFLERAITGARHVEVQLVAGANGRAAALGLRDCSIQRRNQKVLEEAPSPVVPDATAMRLQRASVRLAERAGYRGVATAEYLYDPETDVATFLEVNSRLQVEHTVTECVTGVDLVHAQIDIARGLPWCADGAEFPGRGHAIEVRLNAESPEHDFAPRPGRIRVLKVPVGPGIRVDSGVEEGMTVAPEFDSMIAKVIATGQTRELAVARLRRALAEMRVVVEDGATNRAFLLQLLERPEVIEATADTGWLDRANADGALTRGGSELEALLFAAIVEYRRQRHGQIHEFFVKVQDGIPQNPPRPEPLSIDLQIRRRSETLAVFGIGRDRYLVGRPGALHLVTAAPTGEHGASLSLDGGPVHEVSYAYGRAGIAIEIDGAPHTVEPAMGGTIKAPVPAMVVRISVGEGDRVEAGDRIVTLEAMKLEMPLFAPEAGVVRTVLCQVNQQLAVGQPIVLLDPDESAGTGPGDEEPGSELLTPTPDDAPPIALIYDDRFPSLEAIDRMSDVDARRHIAAVMDAARLVLAGFDADETPLRVLDALLASAESEQAEALTFPERWAALADQLAVFADVGDIVDRRLPGGERPTSAHTAFYEYCRRHHEGGEAVPDELRGPLERGLRAHGVTDFEPSERQREALWRLAIGAAHADRRHRICSALIRVVIRLHEAGVSFRAHPALEDSLTRTVQIADRRFAFVADSARQARYMLFLRKRFARKREDAIARIEASLQQVRDLSTPSDEAGTGVSSSVSPAPGGDAETVGIHDTLALRALDADGSVVPHLIRNADPDDPAAPTAMAWVVRQAYACEHLEVQTPPTRPAPGLLELTLRLGEPAESRDLRVFVGRNVSPKETLVRAGERCADSQFVGDIEIALTGGPVRLDETETADLVGGDAWAGANAEHVTLTWLNGRGLRHMSWRRENGRFVLDERVRDIHPEQARRFELDRLSAFELERLDTPDAICAFRGVAVENPRDERVFVYAGLQRFAPQTAEGRWELDRAMHEAARVLRSAQATRSRRTRLHWNRLVFYVREPLVVDLDAFRDIARGYGPVIAGLGLEKVVLHCNALSGGETSHVVIVATRLSGHRLELTSLTPGRLPVRALTDYQLQVIKARRLGVPYPYEVLAMLEGRSPASESAHPDMVGGRFVEHELDTSGERLIPVDRSPGNNTAAVVVGTITNTTPKHPEGMTRVWIGSDPTREMGALAEPECRRIVAALRLAAERDLPVEWVAISAGARIAMDSGTENLDWTARVLRALVQFTQNGGVVHVIVDAVNVGAQSYWNAEATMLMHTRGLLIMTDQGSMVLTGKRALEISGGVSAEDERGIGGFERIMGPNGQAQTYARDLGEAYAILFDHYRVAYRAPGEAGPRHRPTTDAAERSILEHPYGESARDGFHTVGEVFSAETNPGRKRPFAIRELMRAVADADAGHLERFGAMADADTAVVWDTHVGGYPVSMLGFESRPLPRRGRVPMDGPGSWTGGTLFPQSSRKVARALNAASGNRPVVVLANLSGFDGSPESLRRLQLEYGAEIGRAVTNFEGRLIFVVVGRYHGGAYVVFSKALNPGLRAMAVEGSYASVIGGGPAAAVVFPRDARRAAAADPRVAAASQAITDAPAAARFERREAYERVLAQVTLEKQGEIAARFDAIHDVRRAVEVGSLDAVIAPEDLRPVIVTELRAAYDDRAGSSRERRDDPLADGPAAGTM